MTKELVERVARALHDIEDSWNDIAWEHVPEGTQALFRKQAEAAITATLSSTDGDDGELIAELQSWHPASTEHGRLHHRAANRISSLNARLSEMREALEPFAAKAEYADAIEADDGDYLDSAPLKAGEYRKARAALNLSEGGVSR
jgi:hypothetical protein